MEDLLKTLSRLDAPLLQPGAKRGAADAQKRIALAKCLSDWHLVMYLATRQIFSEVRRMHSLGILFVLIICETTCRTISSCSFTQ
jgi:hypothetical protein